MPSKRPALRRRLYGHADVVWTAVVGSVAAVMVALLLGHLRVEFQIYRLAHERANLVAQRRELQEEQRRLQIERQVRAEGHDIEAAARELGMRPARPEQIYRVED